MSVAGMFRCGAGVVFVLRACKDGWNLWKNKGKTGDATGTVMEVYTLGNGRNPKDAKWAVLRYEAQGREYISENRIQVPAHAQIGTKLPVKYLKERPQRLYTVSMKRFVMILALGAACLVIGLIHG